MSEVETFDEVELGVQGEIGTVTGDDVDLEKNDINDFLDAIQQKDFTTAGKQFDDMVSDRLQDSLDQAKARIAGQIYNKAEEPVED
jgi:hypothetical protein|tara:strand:- start:2347 stop:2604 length:258 start_codon:yes stop_codon:yes gene_type:complete